METLEILLADDDLDDCLFFCEAVKELDINSNLRTVHDGEQLMELLSNKLVTLPNVLFWILICHGKMVLSVWKKLKIIKIY